MIQERFQRVVSNSRNHIIFSIPRDLLFGNDINQSYRDSPKLRGYPSEKMGTRGPMGSRGSVSECFRGPRCTRESAIFGRERQIPAPRSKDGRGFEQKVAGKLSTVCAVNVDEAFSLTRLWNIDIFGPWPSCAFHEEKWKKNKRGWIKGWINAIVISLVNNISTNSSMIVRWLFLYKWY